VDGADPAPRFHFASTLARTVRASGRAVLRLTAPPFTDDETVCTVLGMFQVPAPGGEFADVADDAVLIVDGWTLLRSAIRGAWHFTIFLESGRRLDDEVYERDLRYVREDAPRETSDAAYDISDIDHPLRIHG
jgi:hypothetical protein